MTLIEIYKAWRHRRDWPVSRQLELLRAKVQRDSEWLAHDPKLAALCKRYADLLGTKWMSIVHLSSNNFRTSIGADPVLVPTPVKPTTGKVRFFPVTANAIVGSPHQTFYSASQSPKVITILRVEVDASTFTVISAVMLNKVNAHERTPLTLKEAA